MMKNMIRYLCLCIETEQESAENEEVSNVKIGEEEKLSAVIVEENKGHDSNNSNLRHQSESKKQQSDHFNELKEGMKSTNRDERNNLIENVHPETFKEVPEIKIISMPEHVESKDYIINSPLFGKKSTFSLEPSNLLHVKEKKTKHRNKRNKSNSRNKTKKDMKTTNL